MNARRPLSIVILTLNEENDLPGCLASVAAADDVVVLDSGSTDRTVEIARAAGARVFTNLFVNFAQQRNFAQTEIPFAHPWVFHLDADEQMTPELLAECAALGPDAPFDGFYAAPRMMFAGHWLRRCTDFPAWQARLVRAPGFRFIEVGHGQREAPGQRLGFLRGSYLHDISVRSQEEWDRRHRNYARKEADRYLAESAAAWSPGRYFRAAPLERRRQLKQLSYRLPFRPLFRFLYQYVLKRGVLDGRHAFRYCCLLARYEQFAGEALARARRVPRT